MKDYTDYGFCDVLKKPYDLKDLQAALGQGLGAIKRAARQPAPLFLR